LKGCRIGDLLDESKFEVALGMSRKWDAREAGKEVAREVIQKLSSPPSFFLLFSTIHYDKHGGFEEFLNGVWDVLPEGTPLVGGTVAGFMNNYGCYTRGASAIGVSYKDMNINIGIGRNTKRNPKKAAQNCLKSLNVNTIPFSNNLLIDFVSGTKIPSFPIIGQRRIIKSKFFPKSLLIPLLRFSTKYLQTGMGRENEILDELIKQKPDWLIMGGSCNDENKIEKNFQFYNKEVLSNDLAGIHINTNLDIETGSADGLTPTDIEFNLTKKGAFGCIMKTLDGYPAKKEFLDKMGWPEDYLNERTIFRKSYQYPICYTKHDSLQIRTFGLFFNDYVGVANDLEENELIVHNASGNNLIGSYIELTKKMKDSIDPYFIFGIHCGIILEALGNHIYIVKDELNKIFEDVPFLVVYTAGEHIYIPNKIRRHVNLSYNLAFMGRRK